MSMLSVQNMTPSCGMTVFSVSIPLVCAAWKMSPDQTIEIQVSSVFSASM